MRHLAFSWFLLPLLAFLLTAAAMPADAADAAAAGPAPSEPQGLIRMPKRTAAQAQQAGTRAQQAPDAATAAPDATAAPRRRAAPGARRAANGTGASRNAASTPPPAAPATRTANPRPSRQATGIDDPFATQAAPTRDQHPAARRAAPGARRAATPAARTGTGPIHGNVDTKVFHNSTCQHYNCKNCTQRFASPAEARNAGYSACKICGG